MLKQAEKQWHKTALWHKICKVQTSIKKTGTFFFKFNILSFIKGSIPYFKALGLFNE